MIYPNTLNSHGIASWVVDPDEISKNMTLKIQAEMIVW
jgi:hypothetical protein